MPNTLKFKLSSDNHLRRGRWPLRLRGSSVLSLTPSSLPWNHVADIVRDSFSCLVVCRFTCLILILEVFRLSFSVNSYEPNQNQIGADQHTRMHTTLTYFLLPPAVSSITMRGWSSRHGSCSIVQATLITTCITTGNQSIFFYNNNSINNNDGINSRHRNGDQPSKDAGS